MKRFNLVLECTLVLMLCAAAASLSHLWKEGPLTFQLACVGLVVPAISTVLFLFLSSAVPDLYAVDSLRFPINITLPLIYTVMLLLTMNLLSRVGLSITKVPDNLAAISIWSNTWLLCTTFIAGVACLSVLSFMAGERGRR